MTNDFSHLLIAWYEEMRRDLPWRRTRDPYAIWVSEIMLQQTRVAAVIPYYQRFLARFPTMKALAEAPEESILAAWAGLGYYSRVRNMQKAATASAGAFPATYEEIRALPGIGDYTAAAVASIALDLPHAALDGNVLRVLSRVSNDDGDIGAAATKQRLRALAERLLDKDRPGTFNEAMMELGATVCLPRDPQCLLCPVQLLCKARMVGTENRLPVKRRKADTVRAARTVYIVEKQEALLLWQRPPDSPKLAGFWELPEPEHLFDAPEGEPLGRFRHSITNHVYTFEVRVARSVRFRSGFAHKWLPVADLAATPVSTTTKKALQILRFSR